MAYEAEDHTADPGVSGSPVGAGHGGWSGRVTAEMSLTWLNRLYVYKPLSVCAQDRAVWEGKA